MSVSPMDQIVAMVATVNPVHLLLAYLVGMLLIMYVVFCGDAECHEGGLIGWCNGCVTKSLSKFGLKLLRGMCYVCCCGKKGFKVFGAVRNYICFQRNPLLQIFYFSLCWGGFFLGYRQAAWMGGVLVPIYHKYLPFILTSIGSLIYLVCCSSDPGKITDANVKSCITRFPYDGQIFLENNICKTCNIPKPARSKHCSLCNMCVSRFDHHCVWINQCVGEKNHRYFMLFLIYHSLFCAYITYVIFLCLWAVVDHERLWDAVYKDPATKKIVPVDGKMILFYIMGQYGNLCGVSILTMVMSIVLGLFFTYHVYLLCKNTTTNESFKRDMLCEDLEEREEALYYQQQEEERQREEAQAHKGSSKQDKKARKRLNAEKGDKDSAPTPAEEREPIPHAHLPKDLKTWEVKNIYNRGFSQNVNEILFPM